MTAYAMLLAPRLGQPGVSVSGPGLLKLVFYSIVFAASLYVASGFLASKSLASEPTAQPLSFARTSDNSHPGGVAQLTIAKKSESLPIVRYGLLEPAILDNGDKWLILIGVGLNQLPGEYLLYTRQAGEDEPAEFLKFSVDHKDYPIINIASDELVELEEFDSISELDFNNSQPPVLPMKPPFAGQWNKDFGQLFLLADNDNPDDSKMVAQNYTWSTAPQLSLVRAPQSGIVTKITSNEKDVSNVIIDHGRGVYSLLHGLTDLTIKVGNGVVAGAVLGKVPALGSRNSRSPGARSPVVASPDRSSDVANARVYWQVQLNDVFVNPLLLTQL